LGQLVTLPAIKLTIDIDDELMARVKDVTCAKTNGEAILTAANSMAQLIQMQEFFSEALSPLQRRLEMLWPPPMSLKFIAICSPNTDESTRPRK